MNRSAILLVPCVVLLCSLLSGCGKSAPDDDEAATPAGEVAVTTAVPIQRTFHDSIEAWGSAAGDPQHARSISLAHGGQVTALQVTAGQSVKRGQPLLTIAPDPAARSAYQQAQTASSLAAGELKRTEQLASQRLATQSQLATARKALADAQSALAAQRALGGGATETIDAPADGVITGLQVGLGERVAANAPLLSFTPTHALLAVLGVQPEDGARLRPGMPVQLQPVYGARRTFAGTLRLVGEATLGGDVAERHHGGNHELLRSLDAPPHEIFMWRGAEGVAECDVEMKLAVLDEVRQRLVPDRSREVGFNELQHPAPLPGGQESGTKQ